MVSKTNSQKQSTVVVAGDKGIGKQGVSYLGA
jgi:hypothetical protein